VAPSSQHSGELFQLRAFAATIQSFNGDEDTSARSHGEMIAATLIEN
jgi:hypothetical protein